MTYIYQNPKEYNPDQILDFISVGDMDKAMEGIIGLSLYNNDRAAVKKFIFELLYYKNTGTQFKYALIKALSHIARIDKNITPLDVNFVMNMFQDNDLLQGAVADFIDDYNIFCKR